MENLFKPFSVYLNESKITVDGKYLKFKDGTIVSISNRDDGMLIFRDENNEDFYVYLTDKDIRFEGDSYDKSFGNIKDLAKYLNKNNMKYIGVD